jgi:hypothetical protein
MQPDEVDPQVLAPNAGSASPLAYPLTLVSYAVTNAPALSEEDAADYAALIRYAVDRGQLLGTDPGQLPEGYVPLPTALRAQAETAATAIEHRVGPPSASPSPSPTPSPSSSGPGTKHGSSATGGSGSGLGAGLPVPVASSAAPGPSTSPKPTVSVTAQPVAQVLPTPADPMSAARLAVVVVAALALVASVVGPLTPRAVRWWTARRTQ